MACKKVRYNHFVPRKPVLTPFPKIDTFFCSTLGDILESVPQERRRQCERRILNMVNSYVDGGEDEF
jgi:hypothetical protein